MPTKNPTRITRQAIPRETTSAGPLIVDSPGEENPHSTSLSPKRIRISSRWITNAMIKAMRIETSTATINATKPGIMLANLVRKRNVDWTRACLTCSHITTSGVACAQLRIKTIRPSPSRYQIRFAGFVCSRKTFEPLLDSASFFFFQLQSIGCNPREVQGRHGLEQMIAGDHVQPVRKRKIVNNPRPQFVGHVKFFNGHTGELPKLEQRGRRQHQPPDFLKVSIPQLKHFDQAADLQSSRVLWYGNRIANRGKRDGTAHPLPENRISLHV